MSDMSTDGEIDEIFSSILSSYLKSSSCNSEYKLIFLEEFSKYIENDIKALEVKIQSQDSHYQSMFFQNPFQLPFDIKIEKCYENKDKFDDSKLKQWYGRNCTHGLFNHNKKMIEYLEDYYVSYDRVADYMEESFNSSHSFLFSSKYGFQIHDEIPINYSHFILLKNISRVQFLSQFLTWSHWKHDFT